MADEERYFDEIDFARIRRVKELSEVKYAFSSLGAADPLGIRSKAVVVLAYAAWEGFYNDCANVYLRFLRDRRMKVVHGGWLMLVGALTPDFESLRARNHSIAAKQEFVQNLEAKLQSDFTQFDIAVIDARSNLDFEKISANYAVLGFALGALETYRIRLNKEVVGWRHGVAHGNSPNLKSLDIANHISFVSELLAHVADRFQEAILKHF